MKVLDKDGIEYKQPNRTCLKCKLYPCFIGIKICKIDFAKYGCDQYTKK